ncbi:MAG TPA: NAD(P)-binding domain-containing protein, partial [Steroidobacteraceae bacterium]|nr:NAD(P)-binding domain-containing protein [Steroidobacteraceae bacterium]
MDKFHIAIIGAGPAGISAAARAAELDLAAKRAQPSYILLEGFTAPAKTIQRYQKGKHVMAEPGFLDLRSDVRFAAGTREQILHAWLDDLRKQRVNIHMDAEVKKISGQHGDFQLQLANGKSLVAEHVILAIGLEGNPRLIGAPGDNLPGVQYQLDDPKEFSGEAILVVGAGDSAIENALALAQQNNVWILNRGKEFSRAKDGNLSAVLAAVADPQGKLKCYYETTIKKISRDESTKPPLSVELQTPTGDITLKCHRIIARLGAIAPRKFVESTGIRFPNDRPDAIPELSRRYESNVKGFYVIGSVAGYPLIK